MRWGGAAVGLVLRATKDANMRLKMSSSDGDGMAEGCDHARCGGTVRGGAEEKYGVWADVIKDWRRI